MLGLSEIELERGDPVGAQIKLSLAIGVAGKPLEDPEMLAAATIQADLHLRRDDTERAGVLLAHVSRCLERHPNPYHECWTERLWAAWHRRKGDREGEQEHAQRMRSLAERYGYAVPGDWQSSLPLVDPRSIAVIQVRCFGPFEVSVERRGIEPREWTTANAKAALAYLVLNPAGATRQQLSESLYPGREISRSAVSTVISRPREALEPACEQGAPSRFLIYADGRYRLNPGTPVWCDAAEFLRLCERAGGADVTHQIRKALLERAVALYRGPFLEEFRDLPWFGGEAGRLLDLALAARDEVLGIAGAADDWEALERVASAALRTDACHHPAIKAKIVAIAMQERFEEARRSAEAFAADRGGLRLPG